MRTGTVWIGAIVTGVIAWLASGELSWPARLLAAVLLGPAPVFFVLQAKAAATLPRPLPRVRIYLGSMVGLWLLAAISYIAATASRFSHETIGLIALPFDSYVLWSIGALVASASVVLIFRLLRTPETLIMQEIAPVSPAEKYVFVLLSISAGVCEEMTFRGFLLPAVTTASSSIVGGVVLSSLAFGVLHAHQHVAGALRAAILGALLALPVIVTGSIYPSMTAHALIDIVGGLWLARWLFR